MYVRAGLLFVFNLSGREDWTEDIPAPRAGAWTAILASDEAFCRCPLEQWKLISRRTSRMESSDGAIAVLEVGPMLSSSAFDDTENVGIPPRLGVVFECLS